MIEVLEFIFQDFWHWIGSVILLCCVPIPFGRNGFKLRIGKKQNKDEEEKKN